MKILVYAGVPHTSIAVGLALYKKAKEAGAPSKRTTTYGADLITAVYTTHKKEIRIVRSTPVLFVLRYFLETAPLSIGTDEYAYTKLTADNTTNTDPDTAVFAVGTPAIYTYSQLLVTKIQPELPGALPPVSSLFAVPSPGSYMSPSSRVAYVKRLIKKLKTDNRADELSSLFSGALNFASSVYLSPTSAINKLVVSIGGADAFLGTDSAGADVVLCNIIDPYNNPTDAVATYPPYMVNTATTTIGTAPSTDQNATYGQAQYYPYHYAIISLDTWLALVCRNGTPTYAVQQHGLSNTAANPNIVIKYVLGTTPHTFTQTDLSNVTLTGAWTITGTIAAADNYPAQSNGTYTISGTGATLSPTGAYLVSNVSFTLAVDNVGVPGVFETVYLPDSIPEQPWVFSAASGVLTIGSTTYTTTRVAYGVVAAYTVDWVVTGITNPVITEYDARTYNFSFEDYTASHSSDDAGYESPIANGSWTHKTTRIVRYRVTYENGAVVSSSLAAPIKETEHITAAYSANQVGKDWPYQNSINNTFNMSVAVNNGTYTFDGVTHDYTGPYAKGATVTQTITDSNGAYVSTGLEQNRALRSWSHNPIETTSEISGYSYIIARVPVMESGFIYPIHVYAIGNATQHRTKVYISGVHKYVSPPITGIATAPYRVFSDTSTLFYPNEVTLHTGSYTGSVGTGTYPPAIRAATVNITAKTYNSGYSAVIQDADMANNAYAEGALWMPTFAYNVSGIGLTAPNFYYPTIDYSYFWTAGYYGYKYVSTGANGIGSLDAGYELFPVVHGSPAHVAVIHWRGAVPGTDGICVLAFSVNKSDYAALLSTYQATLISGVQAAIDAAGAAVDATITVLHNNFASRQVMRYFQPGDVYTIFS